MQPWLAFFFFFHQQLHSLHIQKKKNHTEGQYYMYLLKPSFMQFQVKPRKNTDVSNLNLAASQRRTFVVSSYLNVIYLYLCSYIVDCISAMRTRDRARFNSTDTRLQCRLPNANASCRRRSACHRWHHFYDKPPDPTSGITNMVRCSYLIPCKISEKVIQPCEHYGFSEECFRYVINGKISAVFRKIIGLFYLFMKS